MKNSPEDANRQSFPAAGFLGAPLLPTGLLSRQPDQLSSLGARAALLGLPFDCGSDPQRIGSRLGPAALREAGKRMDAYLPPSFTRNPLDELGLVDLGDLPLRSGDLDDAFDQIEQAVDCLLGQDITPVTIGGDGAVTYPQLKAAAKAYPDLAVLHFDAHTDAYRPKRQGLRDNSTTFTYAARERLIRPEVSWHVGLRGPCSQADIQSHTRELGYQLLTMADFMDLGVTGTLEKLRVSLAGQPLYLCWDLDVFDPSAAPGVCDPTWGGLSAREGLALLEGLAGLDIVAVDINTLSPPHDAAGMTAHLAATVLQLCLHLLMARP
ncbi:arginase family protein [Rhodovibrionaceae bacterium A322]